MTEMIIFNISGGLGNQFFQYAFGKSLSIINDVPLYLNFQSFKKDKYRDPKISYFNTEYSIASQENIIEFRKTYDSLHPYLKKIYRHDSLVKLKTYFTDKFEIGYRKNILKANRGYFDGYWSNQKYFIQHSTILKQELSLKDIFITEQYKNLSDLARTSNSVAIHIRRGDYINNKSFSQIFNSLSIDYYERSIKYIQQKYSDINLFIFSDDMKWAKSNCRFVSKFDHVFIEDQLQNVDYLELSLMQKCKHFIIANSTFSWWAAWLGSGNESIVVAPSKWYKHNNYQKYFLSNSHIPESWHVI